MVAKLFDRTASAAGAWTVERCTVDDAGEPPCTTSHLMGPPVEDPLLCCSDT